MRRLAPLALLLLLAACATATPGRVHTWRLTYAPPEPAGTPAPGALRVAPFGIASMYGGRGFVYRAGPYDIGVDAYNQWIGAPAAMITDLLARDLAEARVVEVVLQSPSALPVRWELTGTIEELEEQAAGGCAAHLRVRAALIDVPPSGARRVLFDEAFSADEPCTPGDPAAFVAAMSRATQSVSDAIRTRIVAAVSD